MENKIKNVHIKSGGKEKEEYVMEIAILIDKSITLNLLYFFGGSGNKKQSKIDKHNINVLHTALRIFNLKKNGKFITKTEYAKNNG